MIVGLILYYSLTTYIETHAPDFWFLSLVAINAARLVHLSLWNNKLLNQTSAIHRYIFLLGALMAGVAWASLLLFYSPNQPLTLQLFIMITLIGMPAASLSTNSIYLPAFVAFSLPQILGSTYWALSMAPNLTIEFTLMAITYALLLNTTAYKLNSYLKDSIRNTLTNKALAKGLETANQELSQLAYFDPLTSIHNRRYFLEKTGETLEKAKSDPKNKYIFLLLDLDKFKEVNDSIGHHAGDAYLQQTSERLAEFVKQQPDTLLARLGGDEFIISYPIKNEDSLEQRLEALLKLLTKPIMVDTDIIEPSISIGIAEYPYQGKDISSLLRFADKAMYRAKQNGGNQYFLCTSLHEENSPPTRQ